MHSSSKFSGCSSQTSNGATHGAASTMIRTSHQLGEWEARTTAAIRKTSSTTGLPRRRKGAPQGSKLRRPVDLTSYRRRVSQTTALPRALDRCSTSRAPVGGVTIRGATSTVYSNAKARARAARLSLGHGIDFGVESEQQTALHMFELAGAATPIARAAGFPATATTQSAVRHRREGGTIRVATTGLVRQNPTAKPVDVASDDSRRATWS